MTKNIKNLKKPLLFSNTQDNTVKRINKFEEFELKNKPTLIISKEVQNQILYFHHRTGVKEWSGFLLFKQDGDLSDINNMVLTTRHIQLLDIGSSTFTSIENYDPFETVDDLGEEALEYNMGLLHTHNSMNVFFSGTDMQCLHENAENYPFLLSLITNFAGDFKAKIAFIGKKAESSEKLTLNERLSNLVLNLGKRKESEVLILCDCNIVLEQHEYVVKRYNSLVKKLNDAETLKKSYTYNNYPDIKEYWNRERSNYPGYTSRLNQPSLFEDTQSTTNIDTSLISLDDLITKLIYVDPNASAKSGSLYYVLRKGNEKFEALKTDAEQEAYFDYIDDNFEAICNSHFKKELSPEEISKVSHACITRIKVFKDVPFVDYILEVLESYDLELDNFWRE